MRITAELSKVYPAPTRAEHRAWARKKANDRAVAAYRNSLPTSIVKLNVLLTEAPSPWHAEVISRRIDTVREANRRRNRIRRVRETGEVTRHPHTLETP